MPVLAVVSLLLAGALVPSVSGPSEEASAPGSANAPAAAAPTAAVSPAPPTPAPAPGAPAPSTAPPAPVIRRVVVTIDDLPGVGTHLTLPRLVDVNHRLMKALREAKAPAAVFVNEGKLEVEGETAARTAVVKDWLDAGFTLGNHTSSHKGLTATPLSEWEDDVVRGETVLKSLLGAKGQKLAWFRHPFTQTGPTAEIRKAAGDFLAGRGYRVAPVTIEYSDWVFAALHEDAAYRPDREAMQQVEDAYLAYFDLMVDWYAGLSRDTFGREIPQVLLLHANALNANLLPQLLDRLKTKGYQFVTLDEALADPAYATPDGYVGPWGPSWFHRWRAGLNLPSKFKDEPDPPGWILELWETLRKKPEAPKASATAPARP